MKDEDRLIRERNTLIKELRQDIYAIRRMAKGKYLFPEDMCRLIIRITDDSLNSIKDALSPNGETNKKRGQ